MKNHNYPYRPRKCIRPLDDRIAWYIAFKTGKKKLKDIAAEMGVTGSRASYILEFTARELRHKYDLGYNEIDKLKKILGY